MLPPEIAWIILGYLRGNKSALSLTHVSSSFYYMLSEKARKELLYETRLVHYFSDRWIGFNNNALNQDRRLRNYSDIPIYVFMKTILRKENDYEYKLCRALGRVTLKTIENNMKLNTEFVMDHDTRIYEATYDLAHQLNAMLKIRGDFLVFEKNSDFRRNAEEIAKHEDINIYIGILRKLKIKIYYRTQHGEYTFFKMKFKNYIRSTNEDLF
jgi:hypothetical protein